MDSLCTMQTNSNGQRRTDPPCPCSTPEKYTGWTVPLNSTYNFVKSVIGMSLDLIHLEDRGAGKKEE
jgi:hypothetical protein